MSEREREAKMSLEETNLRSKNPNLYGVMWC